MKQFILLTFLGFTAFCTAQENDSCLEYISEDSVAVLLTPMNDSLKIEYPTYGSVAILYIDKYAMKEAGAALYSGTCGNLDISVQFLDENECSVISELEELSLGICKLKEKTTSMETDFSLEKVSGARYVREMIQKPNTDRILANENCVIVLRARIDQEGNVVGFPTTDHPQTTTNDSKLIAEVIDIVRKETKYRKAPGRAMESMTIRVKLTAN